MWLLSTMTLRLCNFVDGSIPPYAILSHRWEDEELSFANMRDCQMIDDNLTTTLEEEQEEERMLPALAQLRRYKFQRLKSMKGWTKLQHFCDKSRALRLQWAWCDTVCIDKSSSAELQEAINSMFKWYAKAAKCLVYMCDVTGNPLTHPAYCKIQFTRSQWFKRGWTLQELLAPENTIEFYNCDWHPIGTDQELMHDIESTTKIPKAVLEKVGLRRAWSIRDCSIAQRFSWAASRKVTRGEDIAYSLLGLFDVHMPLLYGEGQYKAFRRLQLEILKISEDETILGYDRTMSNARFPSLLADSPMDFSNLSLQTLTNSERFAARGNLYQMTNKGLLMEAVVMERCSKHATLASPNFIGWTSDFALPLLVSKGPPSERTVILQLQKSSGNRYTLLREKFSAKLDWE